MLSELVRDSIILVALLSIAPLVCAGAVSLCISILQAATQIQEQSVGYLAKLFVLFVLCIALGGYASNQAVQFTQRVLSKMANSLL